MTHRVDAPDAQVLVLNAPGAVRLLDSYWGGPSAAVVGVRGPHTVELGVLATLPFVIVPPTR